jgi:hypothetical protein
MAFVHSLVKLRTNGKTGWWAPVELGEASPHYVSFVIPVAENGEVFEGYGCEIITMGEGEKRVRTHELVKRGEDSFVLRMDKREFWFRVCACPIPEGRLAYAGVLEHEDFEHLLVEIEPEDPCAPDELYDADGTFIMGCEPFAHYANVNKQDAERQPVQG